jgi:hypothetical protein
LAKKEKAGEDDEEVEEEDYEMAEGEKIQTAIASCCLNSPHLSTFLSNDAREEIASSSSILLRFLFIISSCSIEYICTHLQPC